MILAAVSDTRGGSATRPTTGKSQVTFTDRDPNSAASAVLKRIGWRIPNDATERDYELSRESFVVRVPENYKAPSPGVPGEGETRYGLLAFIAPGESGEVPREFEALLAKHRLIWVGANHVGNKRAVWIRIGLTLDGIYNVKKRYDIDPNRIFVSGVSGGGRVASFMGVCYADVVRGGIYIIGTDYFKQLPTGRNPNEYWPKAYDAPPGKVLLAAKKQSRHVMLNGETDQNRFQSKAIAEQMKRDGFEHVTYLEAPGVGHRLPGEEWVEKAIEKLDEVGGAK